MALETGTYISDLVSTNPLGSDAKSTADDHLRLIKSCVKATFPNISGAVTPTHTELNYVDGVTSAIQTQIDTKGAIAGQTWTGTHTFPSTTYGVTAAFGASGTAYATLDFVNAVATNAALPAQTGNSGKYLQTNGTTASWVSLGVALVERTSNTMLGASNTGNFIDITSGTFTQTFDAVATLGSGWYCFLRNSGTGDVTLDPNSSEQIDGVTSYIMYPKECRLIQCDGSKLTTIILTPFSKIFTSTGTFTKPAGYALFGGMLFGGGGSGGAGGSAGVYASGGGGGACATFAVQSSSLGSTETVTIGAGGVSVSSSGGTVNGNAGGASSFGAFATAYGGGAGSASATTDTAHGGGGGGIFGVGGNGGTGADSNRGLGGQPTNASASTEIDAKNTGYGGSNAGKNSIYGGAGGGGAAFPSGATVSGNSYYGGGGGGGAPSGSGGTSLLGGAGGAGSGSGAGATGTAGSSPSGGGGGAKGTGASGAGARGEFRIWGIV